MTQCLDVGVQFMESMPNQSIDVEASNVECGNYHVIVDAIFGIGLNREPDNWVGDIMAHLNQSGAFVVSIDVE